MLRRAARMEPPNSTHLRGNTIDGIVQNLGQLDDGGGIATVLGQRARRPLDPYNGAPLTPTGNAFPRAFPARGDEAGSDDSASTPHHMPSRRLESLAAAGPRSQIIKPRAEDSFRCEGSALSSISPAATRGRSR